MKSLGDSISREGHPVYIVPELGFNLHSIPQSAKTLHLFILSIFIEKKKTKIISEHALKAKTFIDSQTIEKIIIVAHSKGGLIGKYLLAHHNHDKKILGLISIATPFSGSAMAKLVPIESARELQKDSALLKDLGKHPEINKLITSIIPKYDNHVWSENGSYLEGAKNINVEVSGHHKILFDKEVQNIIVERIEQITKEARL